jgi:formylglycine-generating enzyme
MRTKNSYAAAVAAAVAAVVFSAVFQPASARAVTIDLVPVGNPGNANDPATGNLYGGVAYDYQIGKYDVTIGQYTEFLNAVAKTDSFDLYVDNMGIDQNSRGISRTGVSGSYSYSVIGPFGTIQIPQATAANRPITFVNWFHAARFANWMANGQPTGAQTNATTESGAYTLVGVDNGGTAPARNVTNPNTGATPTYVIPTENEWYKAAYYNPVLNSGSGGYYTYATQSNTDPGNVPGSGSNQANWSLEEVFSVTQDGLYDTDQNYLTDVGAFTNSASFYGTFDQSGNVWQWNDLDGLPGSSRGIRGGSWQIFNPTSVSSSGGFLALPGSPGGSDLGFRLAVVPVPEPSTYAMALAGLACGAWQMFRRRRAR